MIVAAVDLCVVTRGMAFKGDTLRSEKYLQLNFRRLPLLITFFTHDLFINNLFLTDSLVFNQQNFCRTPNSSVAFNDNDNDNDNALIEQYNNIATLDFLQY